MLYRDITDRRMQEEVPAPAPPEVPSVPEPDGFPPDRPQEIPPDTAPPEYPPGQPPDIPGDTPPEFSR